MPARQRNANYSVSELNEKGIKDYSSLRSYYENEWFPKAYALGITWNEFWKLNPRKIKLIRKGHDEKIKEQDYMAWLFGHYVYSAVATAIEHNFAGKKAKSKYIKEPILQQTEKKNDNYNESNEEVAIFEMKQRIKVLQKQGLPESPK